MNCPACGHPLEGAAWRAEALAARQYIAHLWAWFDPEDFPQDEWDQGGQYGEYLAARVSQENGEA